MTGRVQTVKPSRVPRVPHCSKVCVCVGGGRVSARQCLWQCMLTVTKAVSVPRCVCSSLCLFLTVLVLDCVCSSLCVFLGVVVHACVCSSLWLSLSACVCSYLLSVLATGCVCAVHPVLTNHLSTQVTVRVDEKQESSGVRLPLHASITSPAVPDSDTSEMGQ